MRWTDRHHSAIPDDGAEALAAAQKAQGEAAQRWPEVNRLVFQMRLLRQRNKFAEQIRDSLGVKPQ